MLSLFHRNAIHTSLSLQDTYICKISSKILFPAGVHVHLGTGITAAGDQAGLPARLPFFHHTGLGLGLFIEGHANYIHALLYVKLPRLSVGQTVIIIDPVCDIAALLRLKEKGSPLMA